jgi:hypothetical protein
VAFETAQEDRDDAVWTTLAQAQEQVIKYLNNDDQEVELGEMLEGPGASHGYHFAPYVHGETDKSPWQPQVRCCRGGGGRGRRGVWGLGQPPSDRGQLGV